MSETWKTLTEVYPEWMTQGGIFWHLAHLPGYTPPWGVDNHRDLDYEYHGNRSGAKIVSPLVDSLMSAGALSADAAGTLAGVAAARYGDNWTRLWDAYRAQYNPLENYSMTESGSDKDTGTQTMDKTDTTTYGKNSKVTGTSGSASKAQVYGAEDGVTPQPTDENKVDNTVDQTTADTGTDSVKGLDTRTDDLTRTHELTRSGNIGVTTSQQMLESEIQLRAKYNFYSQVMADLDTILTINYF